MNIETAERAATIAQLNDKLWTTFMGGKVLLTASVAALDDLRFATRDLRATPEFIQGHATDDVNVNFACYTRNIRHKRPYTVSVKKGFIEGEPKMTPSQVQALDQSMARRYGERGPQQRPASPPPKSASEPQEDPDHF